MLDDSIRQGAYISSLIEKLDLPPQEAEDREEAADHDAG